MIRVGLISDTHNYVDKAILDALKGVDEIWHCGDIGSEKVISELETIAPVKAVYGNIDGGQLRYQYKKVELFEKEGFDVIMTHIGGYPEHYDRATFVQINGSRSRTNLPMLLVCGHSHILRIMRDKKYNMLVFNPGAAGRQGFHILRTLLTFTLDNGNVTALQIHELGYR